jgi:hypothetical protein
MDLANQNQAKKLNKYEIIFLIEIKIRKTNFFVLFNISID